MMHNRRCSAAQPPDRVPPQRPSRAATKLSILSSKISFIQCPKLHFWELLKTETNHETHEISRKI
ncbi:MAG: hypothetical protein LBQ50_09005 [Planctomycetaceae bacterium]|nr:hypothetical protein [Planctomycetaceae bacterium]